MHRRWDHAEHYFTTALQAARQEHAHPHHAIHALLGLGRCALARHTMMRALSYYQEAVLSTREPGTDAEMLVLTLIKLGALYLRIAQHNAQESYALEAKCRCTEALEILGRLPSPPRLSPALQASLPLLYEILGTVALEEEGKKSKNRKKARQAVAKAHLNVQRQREDVARKQANALVSSHDFIAFEDVQIRNMVRNRHLSKSIHDAAWGQFLAWVNYYAALHGIPVVAVPPQYTSQNCSACGTLVKKSLSVRTHICTSCGVVLERDHNAAVNILQKALSTIGHMGTDAPLSA